MSRVVALASRRASPFGPVGRVVGDGLFVTSGLTRSLETRNRWSATELSRAPAGVLADTSSTGDRPLRQGRRGLSWTSSAQLISAHWPTALPPIVFSP